MKFILSLNLLIFTLLYSTQALSWGNELRPSDLYIIEQSKKKWGQHYDFMKTLNEIVETRHLQDFKSVDKGTIHFKLQDLNVPDKSILSREGFDNKEVSRDIKERVGKNKFIVKRITGFSEYESGSEVLLEKELERDIKETLKYAAEKYGKGTKVVFITDADIRGIGVVHELIYNSSEKTYSENRYNSGELKNPAAINLSLTSVQTLVNYREYLTNKADLYLVEGRLKNQYSEGNADSKYNERNRAVDVMKILSKAGAQEIIFSSYEGGKRPLFESIEFGKESSTLRNARAELVVGFEPAKTEYSDQGYRSARMFLRSIINHPLYFGELKTKVRHFYSPTFHTPADFYVSHKELFLGEQLTELNKATESMIILEETSAKERELAEKVRKHDGSLLKKLKGVFLKKEWENMKALDIEAKSAVERVKNRKMLEKINGSGQNPNFNHESVNNQNDKASEDRKRLKILKEAIEKREQIKNSGSNYNEARIKAYDKFIFELKVKLLGSPEEAKWTADIYSEIEKRYGQLKELGITSEAFESIKKIEGNKINRIIERKSRPKR